MSKKIRAFILLLRPANILTSISDVWAGFAVSGTIYFSFRNHETVFNNQIAFVLLTFSMTLICAGDMILADYFNLYHDRVDHPEKPLPQGTISKMFATFSGFTFLILGSFFSFLVNPVAGVIALLLCIIALFYNVYGRYHSLIGPLNMGFFRGGSLLLGISIMPSAIGFNFAIVFIPIVYIAAITSISRFEFSGISRVAIQLAGWLYILVILYLLAVSFINQNFWISLPFIIFLFFQIFIPITQAFKAPSRRTLQRTVSQGILSLIILNAALAASFSGILFGLIIISLLPLTNILSRYYPLI